MPIVSKDLADTNVGTVPSLTFNPRCDRCRFDVAVRRCVGISANGTGKSRQHIGIKLRLANLVAVPCVLHSHSRLCSTAAITRGSRD